MDPGANMEKDSQLAQQVREGKAPLRLRLYGWNRPAVSLGRRQPLRELPPDLLAMPLVRRPTGGGAVVHSEEELTYALAVSREALPEDIPLKRLTRELHGFLQKLLIERGAVSEGSFLSPVEVPALILSVFQPLWKGI